MYRASLRPTPVPYLSRSIRGVLPISTIPWYVTCLRDTMVPTSMARWTYSYLFLCGLGLLCTEVRTQDNFVTTRMNGEHGLIVKYGDPLVLNCTTTADILSNQKLLLVHKGPPEYRESVIVDGGLLVAPYNGLSAYSLRYNTHPIRILFKIDPVNYNSSGQYFCRIVGQVPQNITNFARAVVIISGDNVPSNDSCGSRLIPAADVATDLKSPGYPDKSANNLHCTWTIVTRGDHYTVRLETLLTRLESCHLCDCDSHTAYDGSIVQTNVLTKWCGNSRVILFSTGPTLTVQFNSNNINASGGFWLKYKEEPDTCGGHLIADSSSKYITSLHYPVSYPNNLRCIWHITGNSSTERIKLFSTVYDKMDLASSSRCDNDYISVYDGNAANASLLGKICGRRKRNFVSAGREMRVEFYSDSTGTGKGFRLQYNSGSYAYSKFMNLTAHSEWKTFTSPGYPGKYPKFITYEWIIYAPKAKDIVCAVAEYFDVADTGPCKRFMRDNVEIFDGHRGLSLGIWCGTNKPNICSFRNSMLIRFYSNKFEEGNGFKIRYGYKVLPPTPGDDYTNLWPVVGGVGGGLTLGAVCIGMIFWRQRRTREKLFTDNPSRPVVRSAQHTSISSAQIQQLPLEVRLASIPQEYNYFMKGAGAETDVPPISDSLPVPGEDINNVVTSTESAKNYSTEMSTRL